MWDLERGGSACIPTAAVFNQGATCAPGLPSRSWCRAFPAGGMPWWTLIPVAAERLGDQLARGAVGVLRNCWRWGRSVRGLIGLVGGAIWFWRAHRASDRDGVSEEPVVVGRCRTDGGQVIASRDCRVDGSSDLSVRLPAVCLPDLQAEPGSPTARQLGTDVDRLRKLGQTREKGDFPCRGPTSGRESNPTTSVRRRTLLVEFPGGFWTSSAAIF